MLFEKLTAKDTQLIQSFLNAYGKNPYSETYYSREARLQDILRHWDKAKNEYLYQLFGNQFILEKQVEYYDSPSVIARNLANAMSFGGEMYSFQKAFRCWSNNLDFDFLSSESCIISHLINTDCLCYGTLGESSFMKNYLPCTIDFGNGKKIKVEASSKPMRVLGKLVKMFDLSPEYFEAFRLEHSRILNTKKITGTLCISIHPLDYMTMSVNCEKWSSCMSWSEYGSYRAGTVEMLNSPMVVVAYLKSDSNNFTWNYDDTWNSKKWRLLAIVNKDAILSIKAYPYHHEALTRTTLEWLKELAAKNLNWNYGSVIQLPNDSQFFYEETKTNYKVDLIEGRMMYCDWGCDTHYGCFDAVPESFDKDLRIDYCGVMSCMWCGNIEDCFYDESYIYCEDCCSYGEEEDYSCCERCGNRVYDGEGYWVDDYCYCENCIDAVADRCAIEDNYYFYEDLERVYLARTPDNPNIDADEYARVHRCYTDGTWGISRYYMPAGAKIRATEDGIYYLNKEDLTARGFNRIYDLWEDDGINAYFEEN